MTKQVNYIVVLGAGGKVMQCLQMLSAVLQEWYSHQRSNQAFPFNQGISFYYMLSEATAL